VSGGDNPKLSDLESPNPLTAGSYRREQKLSNWHSL